MDDDKKLQLQGVSILRLAETRYLRHPEKREAAIWKRAAENIDDGIQVR